MTASAVVAVREATVADLEAVVALRLALVRESRRNPIYGRIREDAAERARGLFRSQLASERETTFLAERDGRVVGILRCVESGGSPLLEPDRYCYVSSTYVVPEERRHGVLRELMAAAERWCAERGIGEMRLHNIPESEVANRAWEAFGFRVAELVRVRRLLP